MNVSFSLFLTLKSINFFKSGFYAVRTWIAHNRAIDKDLGNLMHLCMNYNGIHTKKIKQSSRYKEEKNELKKIQFYTLHALCLKANIISC